MPQARHYSIWDAYRRTPSLSFKEAEARAQEAVRVSAGENSVMRSTRVPA